MRTGNMYPMLNAVPKLTFANPELIAKGVNVFPIVSSTNTPFKSTYVEIQPGCSTPKDNHEEEERWVILKGSGRLEYDDKLYLAKPQDIFYFESLKYHTIYNDSDEVLLIHSIYW